MLPYNHPTSSFPLIDCAILRADSAVASLDMLMPKGGVNWKSAKSKLPPSKAVLRVVTNTRLLLAVAALGTVLLLWRGLSGTAEMGKYVWQTPNMPNSSGGCN